MTHKHSLRICIQLLSTVFLSVGAALFASSHSGGLDSQGGHRDSSTGEYHCHRAGCEDPHDRREAIGGSHGSNQYDRDDWGGWIDQDGDCQDTRQEILISQSQTQVELTSDGCRVESGLWIGPYSGDRFTDPSDLDIDHIVPLAWAHRNGAQKWPDSRKRAFANDPINLLAVDNGLNRSKGARGPGEWLPPSESFYCNYFKGWARVLITYELQPSGSDRQQFQEAVRRCSE